MKVVYFPRSISFIKGVSEGKTLTPSVGFGLVDSTDGDRVIVTEYSLLQYFVDGVPEINFVEDAEWHKLPTGFKKDKDHTKYQSLITSRLNDISSADFAEFKSFSKNARINNPDDILYAANKGWLVERCLISGYKFDIKIEDNNYKLVRIGKEWTQVYGNSPSSYFEYTKNLYDKYDDAMNASKGIIANYYVQMQENFKLDVEDSILWVLGKMPENKAQECEFALRTLPYSYGFCLRFYEGEVLFRNGGEDNWVVVFSLKT